MKKTFKILSIVWLLITLAITGIMTLVFLISIFPFNKKLFSALILLTAARVGQKGINSLGFIYQIFKGNNFSEYIMKCAFIEDMKANVYNGQFFNDSLLIPEAKNKFGEVGETISDNLGEGQRDQELDSDGWLLVKFLHLIDTDHAINSIRND